MAFEQDVIALRRDLDKLSRNSGSNITAEQILEALITIDGSDSGLDADKLDGYHYNDILSLINAKLDSSTYTANDILSKLLGVDGAGSGLDADKLDGLHVTDIVNTIYPVGSIYMSVNNVSPQTLFGGGWEQIKDKFLLSTGDTYANGSTGGSATHTLSESEMPTHKHDVSVPTSGAGTTGGGGSHSHTVPYKDSYASGTVSALRSNSISGTSPTDATNTVGNHAHSTPNHSHSISESNKGSGSAHNNMPPYLSVFMWKRVS